MAVKWGIGAFAVFAGLAMIVIAQAAPARGANSQPCEVASLVIDAVHAERVSAMPVVFSRETGAGLRRFLSMPGESSAETLSSFRHRFSKTDDPAYGWVGSIPDIELAMTFLAAKELSALDTCPDLAAHLRRSGISIDRRLLRQVVRHRNINRPRRTRRYEAQILSVSLPIMDADGTDALVTIVSSYGPRDGSGRVVLFRRSEDRGWALAGSLLVYVS